MNDINVEESFESLSRTQLMWRKFKRNKLALAGALIVITMYTSVLLGGFISFYDFNDKNESYVKAPPQKIRIIDENGKIGRPFVYGYKKVLDEETFRRYYEEDKNKKNYIYFLARGSKYKFLGLFETDLHLFGTKNEDETIFLLGTDRFGRDMLARILVGGRVTMSIGLIGVIISVVLGSIIGTISGYYGGLIDLIVQRVIEFLLSFPRIPLWMTLSAALPPDWSSVKIYFGIVTILAFLGWTRLARQVRAKVLSYREEEYILAAKAAGASTSWIIFRHLIPKSLSHIIVVATLSIPGMILGEASLSFLGLGIQPPMTSWGVLLQDVQNVRSLALTPWLFFPAIFIIVTILAFNFLGDGIRDAADPFSD